MTAYNQIPKHDSFLFGIPSAIWEQEYKLSRGSYRHPGLYRQGTAQVFPARRFRSLDKDNEFNMKQYFTLPILTNK